MVKLVKRSSYENILVFALVLTTLIVTPFYSYDPINIPKLVSISTFGFIAFGLLCFHWNKLRDKRYRSVLVISVSFVFWITLSVILSDNTAEEALFGVTGRNTGLTTYFSLILAMMLAVFISSSNFNEKLNKALLTCGLVSILYGLVQFVGLDPFNWINPYSPVFGFFGNPNFQSAFVGISATQLIVYFLKNLYSINVKIISFFFILLSLFVVHHTESTQGYIVYLLGTSTILYFWIKAHDKYSKFNLFFLTTLLIGMILILSDILQKSPWKPKLYEPSISLRGDYWRAGWNISKENPFFGIGLDGFRDNYRQNRDFVAAHRNPTEMVDSAHNLFLDISSSGGFPLLILYICLIILVLSSILKVIKRSADFDLVFIGIVGAWIAYQVQSVISINQIGLAIWGWVLSGAIIGYEINSRDTLKIYTPIKTSYFRWNIFIGLMLGLSLNLSLFTSDGEFRKLIAEGDVVKIEENLSDWPQSVIKMNIAARIFINGGLENRALKISQSAVKLNPKNFEAWELIYRNPVATERMEIYARNKLRELDPFNPTLK
jgi:O-antigen ligase